MDTSKNTATIRATGVSANLYLIQGDNSILGSTDAVVVINDHEYQNAECVVPFLQPDPQMYVATKEDMSTDYENSQEYYLVTPNQQLALSHNELSSAKTNSSNKTTMTIASAENESMSKNSSNCTEEDFESKAHRIQNFVHIADKIVLPRAVAVLPAALQIRRNCISPRRSLTARVRFGPVQGIQRKIFSEEARDKIAEAAASNTPVFLIKRENDTVFEIDVSDKDKSNWLSLLPLGTQSTSNVWLYEEDNELYGITTKDISSRTPLLLGYSQKYAKVHCLSAGQPVLNLEEALQEGQKQWWCLECRRNLSSFALLEKHKRMIHTDKKSPRRYYRCSECSQTFSRLFTLKRHIAQSCPRKPEKSTNLNLDITSSKHDMPLCSTPNGEDNRMPSDESLQNYTNGLDFSTNLFDTDRMPNLDMSGSPRSNTEFNEDNSLPSDVAFPIVNENKAQRNNELIFETCAYCNQPVAKEKYRQHFRECPARRLQCECGQVFYKKEKLAKHIYLKHSTDLKTTTIKQRVLKSSSEAAYKCEDCKIKFKRRGMYVNHLWRVHKISAVVPLERLVRHYPCHACPKLYRSAAKRDRHVRKHHPGEQMCRAAPIEGERRSCEPASCPACPRQYVTRAKLLQHMRVHHPRLAAPIRQKTVLRKTSTKKNADIDQATS